MKTTRKVLGRLLVGSVLACGLIVCSQSNARIFDPALKQKGAGLFFNASQNQIYARYQITGFEPDGYYFVTSKTNLLPGDAPVWNTYTLEGYLHAPNATNLLCRYGIPLDNSEAKFFRLANFDGTYEGLFAPSSAIIYPTNSQVIDLRTSHYFQAKGEADDAQGICQITLSLDGQMAVERAADFPGDALNYKFNSYFLPSGEHTLMQTVHNFGESGVPTNDLHIDRLTTDSQPVTFMVSNNFAYVSPSPISLEGDGYSLTIETPWTNRLLTASVMDSNNIVAQVLTNYSGDDGLVSFAWDGTDNNGNAYTNETVTFRLNSPTSQKPSSNFQGPAGTIPQLTIYRSKPPIPGKISLAYQNIGLVNAQARTMLEEAHAVAALWGSQSFPDMKPIYQDEPRRIPDFLSLNQWLDDLVNVREVWAVCHTAWGYQWPYTSPSGRPFTSGNLIDNQGLFGDDSGAVSVRQISAKLKNIFDYEIKNYYGHQEVPSFYEEKPTGLWSAFYFKHIMSSVYLDSCYSALTSLPMAFGIIPRITYGADFNASFFGWTINEEYESSILSPWTVHFSTTFNAAYLYDPTISVGMKDAAVGAGTLYGISAKKYAVFGNPQHPYLKH
jgi:hypothetical protein